MWEPSSRVAAQSWTMKLSVALFFAGLFGALAAVFILLSFGTDYWLLASERCYPNPDGSAGSDVVTIEVGVGFETVADQRSSQNSLFSFHIFTLSCVYWSKITQEMFKFVMITIIPCM